MCLCDNISKKISSETQNRNDSESSHEGKNYIINDSTTSTASKESTTIENDMEWNGLESVIEDIEGKFIFKDIVESPVSSNMLSKLHSSRHPFMGVNVQ